MSTGVKLSTVRKWDFDCLGYKLNEEGCVSKIYCKTCREYYLDEEKQSSTKSTGSVKVLVDTYVKGTSVIKKNNFIDHITKNKDHQTTLVRLKEKKLLAQCDKSTESVCAGQSTILQHVRNLNRRQHSQLQRKFQLAHYTASTARSFQSYGQFAEFESKYHGVDMGNAYMDRKACSEIIKFISMTREFQT